MDRRQLNKFNMYRSIQAVTTSPQHQDAVQAIPAFSRTTKAFSLVLPLLQKASKIARGLVTGGITATTDSVRDELASAAATISSGVVAYAVENQDEELAASAHVSRSSVAYGRADDSAEVADNLLASALARVSALADYGITRDVLDDFDALIQSFSDRIGRPRATINQRKTVRASLPELFEAADRHLAQMDRLAEVLKRTHPEFVAEYQANRRIIHLPATRPERQGEGGEEQTAPTEAAHAEPTAPRPSQPATAPSPASGSKEGLVS